MSTETTGFGDWLTTLSRNAAATVAAHPERDRLSVAGPLDVLPARVRPCLELRWADDGELHGRRADSISPSWYRIAAATGEPDVAQVWRFVADLGMAPGVEVTDDDRRRVAAGLVAIARRERDRAGRAWSVQSVAAAVAGRYVQTRAVRIDGAGALVGHLRADEPSAADVARPESALAAMSPMNRLMGSAPAGPRWPEDKPITADSVRAECALHGLLQRDEIVEAWAEVVAEIRRRAAP